MIYVGIDPGYTGALAALDGAGAPISVRAMPQAGRDVDGALVAAWLRDVAFLDDALVAAERVHAMPRDAKSRSFRFGLHTGTVLGVVAGLGLGLRLVAPQTWKAVILRGTRRDKAAAVAWCRQRWPQVSLLATPRSRVAHDGMADALCIAEWLRRDELGK